MYYFGPTLSLNFLLYPVIEVLCRNTFVPLYYFEIWSNASSVVLFFTSERAEEQNSIQVSLTRSFDFKSISLFAFDL